MATHNKTKSRLAGLALLAWSGMALAAWELNFQAPATKAAQTVIDLHDLMMIIIVIRHCTCFACPCLNLVELRMYEYSSSRV